MSTIHPETESSLQELQVGKRFWFSFGSPEHDQGHALCLRPFSNTAGMSYDITPKKSYAIGFAQVHTEGHLCFYTPVASQELYQQIADWVMAYLPNNPLLQHLSHAELAVMYTDGSFGSRFQDPKRWEQVSKPPVFGTRSHTIKTLSEMEDNENLWFWMALNAQGEPFLALVRQRHSPDGTAFAAAVTSYKKTLPSAIKELKGIARWTPENILVFATQDKPVIFEKVMQKLISEKGFERLSSCRVALLKDGAFVKSKRISTPQGQGNKTPQSKPQTKTTGSEIIQLSSDFLQKHKQGFWAFGKDGLLLAAERDTLKQQMTSCFSQPPKIKGKIKIGDKFAVFSSRQPIKGILPRLAKYILKQQELTPLIGCRITQKTAAGDTVEKDHQPALWSQ